MATDSTDQTGASAPKLTMRTSTVPRALSGAARGGSRAQSNVESIRRSVRKIRFTSSEWAAIVRHAHACGHAPARYVREVALGAVPRASRTRLNAPVVRELGALLGVLQRIRSAVGDTAKVSTNAADAPAPACLPTPGSTAAVTEVDEMIARLLAVIRRLG